MFAWFTELPVQPEYKHDPGHRKTTNFCWLKCLVIPIHSSYLKGKSFLDQDLSYGAILAGRPGAWLVKKIFFYMHAIKKVKKGS